MRRFNSREKKNRKLLVLNLCGKNLVLEFNAQFSYLEEKLIHILFKLK